VKWRLVDSSSDQRLYMIRAFHTNQKLYYLVWRENSTIKRNISAGFYHEFHRELNSDQPGYKVQFHQQLQLLSVIDPCDRYMINIMNDITNEEPAQLDRLWVGYHPRAAIPLMVAAATLSMLISTGKWYLNDLSELADEIGSLALFAVAWGLWPLLIAIILYRTVTFTYRLTDRALYYDFGFWYAPQAPVWLWDITTVHSGGDWLSRALGVGWVEIRTADRVVRWSGVRHPQQVAETIRAAVAAVQRAGTPWPETARVAMKP
jgi:hypothetical protein